MARRLLAVADAVVYAKADRTEAHVQQADGGPVHGAASCSRILV